ncbi:Macrophage expressed protein [Fasciola gigantica]|uniref:Macrophage expressed protein n=1 Tax=Fasciola gigantica TaxID=46835 RepID=A0A504WW50_FASGI|nr:Macrophage expressed protein [Fasciola gigantica]
MTSGSQSFLELGWDNLVNEERGPTVDRERYETCRRSTDGRFIIPDDITIEPRKHSQLDLTSDVFESTSQCTSLTAYSVNAAVDFGVNYYRINGDFSIEKESLRENATIAQIEQFDKGNTNLAPVRGPHTSLDETQLLTLEAGLKAFYLADLIVRDYGTHSIASVDAGGVLVKTDILDEDTKSLAQQERWKLAASASTTFASILKLKVGGSMSSNQSVAELYSKKSTHSRINSYGGPIFRAYQMNLSDWEQGLDDQLVVIDRSGQPIHELITGRSMPELAEHVTLRLSKTIKSAVERYYKSNAVIASSWHETSKCEQQCAVTVQYWCALDPSLNLTVEQRPQDDLGLIFGGLYTDKEVNPVTHQFSCPEYSWPLLMGRRIRICLSTDRELGEKHAMLFGGFYSCQYGNPLVSVVSVNRTNKSQEQVAVRGWMSSTVERISSRTRRANTVEPKMFIGGVRSEGAEPAAVEDYSSLFASLWPKRCPDGYTAHLAAMEDTCQVTFCVPANTIKGKRKRYLKRPPFVLPLQLTPTTNKPGLDEQPRNRPITLPGSDGTRLTRVDGEWVRSESVPLIRSDELEQQKAISIALGSTLAALILMVICMGICVVLVQRAMRRHNHTANRSVGD